MSTIIEALRNANYNLNNDAGGVIAEILGKEQLRNAVGLLEKGYALNEDVEPLLEHYNGLKNVPEAKDV